MSASVMGSLQGLATIEARLARPPQDPLEAAIVLEAWAGVRPTTALELGRDVMPHSRSMPATSTGIRRRDLRPPNTMRVQGVALLVMLVAVSLWARPLIAWIGSANFAIAWRVALPVILSLQWITQSRFAEGERLGQLRPHTTRLAVVLACATLTIGLFPRPTVVACIGLMLPWLGMVVVAETPAWASAQCLIVLLFSIVMGQTASPRITLLGLAVTSGGLMLLALARTPTSDVRRFPAGQSLAAGLVGGGMGVLLVLGVPSQLSGREPFIALLMIPSVVGGLWGSGHLRRLWLVIPRSLTMTTVLGSQDVPRVAAVQVFVGATIRYLLSTALLTLTVFLVAGVREEGWIELSIGYGLVGLAGLLASLAWSYGHRVWTTTAVATALLAVALYRSTVPTSGIGLTIGATVMCVMLLSPVLGALRQMEQNYATRLQIP